MKIAQIIWLLCGLVLAIGGLTAIVVAGHGMGFAPLLAGAAIVLSVDVSTRPGYWR